MVGEKKKKKKKVEGMFLKELLPIGTIVRLRGQTKKLLIISNLACPPTNEEKGHLYEYMACLYPEGLMDYRVNYYFGEDDIAEIYHFCHRIDEGYLKRVLMRRIMEGKKINLK